VNGEHALVVTGFWTVAVTAALVAACSTGNAEPPLVAYTTTALLATLAGAAGDRRFDLLAAIGAAGALLTKNEGAIAVALVLIGVVGRDRRVARRALPLLGGAVVGFSTWLAARLTLGLPLTDPIRERALAVSFEHLGTIVASMPGHLGAGTRGLAWLIPLALLLAVPRKRLLELLPALTLAGGLLAFLVVYYLHAEGDPSRLISWTAPRVTLPALSALILAAGLGTGRQHPPDPDPAGWEGELTADR
jgi:hypothetical protein